MSKSHFVVALMLWYYDINLLKQKRLSHHQEWGIVQYDHVEFGVTPLVLCSHQRSYVDHATWNNSSNTTSSKLWCLPSLLQQAFMLSFARCSYCLQFGVLGFHPLPLFFFLSTVEFFTLHFSVPHHSWESASEVITCVCCCWMVVCHASISL